MNQKIISLLSQFISIQSVSTDNKRKGELLRAADFLTEYLTSLGFQIHRYKKDQSPPLVVASYTCNDPRAKTIGIYGHYDVQPEDPIGEWESPPFVLTKKNGKMYGRGVADNKGHIIQNVVSISQLIDTKKLRNNIIFIFEGEEERGSSSFEKCIQEAIEILSAVDVFYITDVGMYDKNVPQILYGLRGIVYFELILETGKLDLHSGVWGNRVINPVQVAVDLFSKIKNLDTGKIMIPGFYEDVKSFSKTERKLLTHVSRSDNDQKEEAATYMLMSLDKNQPYLSAKIYPSLDINGIISGYTGEGSKTVIPRKILVKFSTRLVEYQKPEKIIGAVSKFVKKELPESIKYQLHVLDSAKPFYTDFKNPFITKTAKILEDVFGNKTRYNRSGGSIPAAEILERLLGKPIVLTGFTLPDDRIHAPQENFDEEMFFKGIDAFQKIYSARF